MNKIILILLFTSILVTQCDTIPVWERQVSIPSYQWESSLVPRFEFDIEDTTAYYQVFLFLRHRQSYAYNNIWLRVYANFKEQKLDEKKEFVLANKKQWLGKEIVGDIVEHFIPMTPLPIQIKQNKLNFLIQHIMRDDPLPQVMSVGIRIQKMNTIP